MRWHRWEPLLLGDMPRFLKDIPNMKKLGLYNIQDIDIPEKEECPIGAFGKAAEQSVRKK